MPKTFDGSDVTGGGIRGGRLTSTRGQSSGLSLSKMLLLFRFAEWKLVKELSADLPANTPSLGVLQTVGWKMTGASVNEGRGNGSIARADAADAAGCGVAAAAAAFDAAATTALL